MRISQAIKLHNERQRIKNIESGRKENFGFVKKSDLAAKIWTNQNNPRSRMSDLISGKAKMFKAVWVDIICKLTGVDANFLFGQDSEHDDDFWFIK